jgi:hypothetical protein
MNCELSHARLHEEGADGECDDGGDVLEYFADQSAIVFDVEHNHKLFFSFFLTTNFTNYTDFFFIQSRFPKSIREIR